MPKFNEHQLSIGMSGSGKSVNATEDVIRDADRGDTAIIIQDPHPKSLAAGAFEQLVARGHQSRILYDRLYELDHSLGYDFLQPSLAKDSMLRYAENDLRIRSFVDILLRRRGQQSLAGNPLTEEWVMKALWLFVEQEPRKILSDLHRLFIPRNKTLRSFLDDCTDPERAEPFKDLYDGSCSRGQYAPAERLISSVTTSPSFTLRCRPSFCFETFLENRGILIMEGGQFGTLSNDALRIMLGSTSLKTIEYVRNRPRPVPRISHYMDEANNVGLIGDHECRALAELRKNNYGCKIMVQTLDFPTSAITESVLNNTATHVWFCISSSKLAQQGAADLGDSNMKSSLRSLGVGECYVKTPGKCRRMKVKMSEDPWVFPGLSKKKAAAALKVIRQRPEYQRRTGDDEMPSSKEGSPTTPPPSSTSSTSSPADRLRTAGSQNSEKGDASDTSEM